MSEEPDKELQREMKIGLGGFFLMISLFILWFGTFGVLSDLPHSGRPDLINKAVLGGPIYLYLALYIIFGPPDSPADGDLTRWKWVQNHWGVALGLIAFEALCLSAWVSYLHHHGFPHVS